MKERKILWLVIIVSIVIGLMLSACRQDSNTNQNTKIGEYEVQTIDGCEYLVYNHGFGNSWVYAITHKGNCKNPHHVDNHK